MANFLIADAKRDYNEGFYDTIEGDSGGETLWGIARNKNPHWDGWAIVDKYKGGKNFPAVLKTIPLLAKLRQEFYKKDFWNRLRGDEILDQEIASKAYDTAVNVGVPPAVRFLQEAAGVAITGHVDDATIKSLNSREATA
jgi:lysozyme family protein